MFGIIPASVARKCEAVCSSPDSECEDQTDFSAEGEQGGHGCAGVHPRQRWICHAGHRWGGISTSEPYTNCSKELWKSSDRSAMRRMMHLRTEIDGATNSCSTGFPVSFLIFWERKCIKSSHSVACRGLTLTNLKRTTKDWLWGIEMTNSQKKKQV